MFLRFAILSRFVFVLAATACLCVPAHALRTYDTCLPSHVLPLNDTIQVDTPWTGGPASFTVAVPSTGQLALEIAVPGYEERTPWIEISSTCLGDLSSSSLNVLDRSLGRQLLDIVTPGIYYVRVGQVEPAQNLGTFKISSRFFSDLATKNGEDDDEGDGTELVDIEIPPVRFDPFQLDREGCGTAGEPANDLSYCARRLAAGRSLESSLASPGRDDHDYYAFHLERPQRVRISASGDTDTFGVLFDASGQRLLHDDDSGEGAGFALDANLAAGPYVVRVEGRLGATGAYDLLLDLEE